MNYAVGIETIAWNTIALGKVNSNHRPCQSIELTQQQKTEALEYQAICRDRIIDMVKQISRLTVVVDEMSDAQRLNLSNEFIRNFDIVAAKPGNAQVFEYLCKTAEIDLIAIDFSTRVPFPVNKSLLDAAVKRGIFFEIIYSPLITCKLLRGNIDISCSYICPYSVKC